MDLPNFVLQFHSAYVSLQMFSRGYLDLYLLGSKVDFLFWAKRK